MQSTIAMWKIVGVRHLMAISLLFSIALASSCLCFRDTQSVELPKPSGVETDPDFFPKVELTERQRFLKKQGVKQRCQVPFWRNRQVFYLNSYATGRDDFGRCALFFVDDFVRFAGLPVSVH